MDTAECGKQNNVTSSKDVQAYIPGTCVGYFHDRRDFADVIKVRALTWGDYPKFYSWA